jgi:general secretion pathway protein G
MNNTRRPRGGFTLIEVLLVLVIIAGLAAVAVVAIGGSREQANIDKTKALMGQLEGALERYHSAFNEYPTEEQGGLRALVEKPSFEDEEKARRWTQPFTRPEKLKDAWGNEFTYELVEVDRSGVTVTRPQIISSGPDKEPGTEDDIRLFDPEEEM